MCVVILKISPGDLAVRQVKLNLRESERQARGPLRIPPAEATPAPASPPPGPEAPQLTTEEGWLSLQEELDSAARQRIAEITCRFPTKALDAAWAAPRGFEQEPIALDLGQDELPRELDIDILTGTPEEDPAEPCRA